MYQSDIKGISTIKQTSPFESTIGRLFLFVSTLIVFSVVCIILVLRHTPTLKLSENLAFTFSLIYIIGCFFSFPILLEKAGVGVYDANWKPYMHLYRLSFLSSVIAFYYVDGGFGSEYGMGRKIPVNSLMELALITSPSKGQDYSQVLGGKDLQTPVVYTIPPEVDAASQLQAQQTTPAPSSSNGDSDGTVLVSSDSDSSGSSDSGSDQGTNGLGFDYIKSYTNTNTDYYGDYFVLNDGFVLLNSTRAFVRTLSPNIPNDPTDKDSTENIPSIRQQGRLDAVFEVPTQYRSVLYFPDLDPFTKPPPPPLRDTYKYIIFSPIIQKWDRCATRYAVSSQCTRNNHIMGFAYKEVETDCKAVGSIACQFPKPQIKPSYNCQRMVGDMGWDEEKQENFKKDPVLDASNYKGGRIEGLCGRLVRHPPRVEIEEIVQTMMNEGWVSGVTMNYNSSLFFVNVDDDPRISDYKNWKSGVDNKIMIGIIFISLTVIMIVITSGLDLYTDHLMQMTLKMEERAKGLVISNY